MEKYIDHVHTLNGIPAKIGSVLTKEITNNFKKLLKYHRNGSKIFFADTDRIKKLLLNELETTK